jgi:CRISPR system Cascade subunit CasA
VLNLLSDDWLPVVRDDRTHDFIRPAQIAETVNPVMSIDWPRADFCIATLELLVGLLATACPPEGDDAWLDWWERAPSVADLDRAFEPLVGAFNLDGDGPRFLQSPTDLGIEGEPIEALLLESPGSITASDNADLLVHRERYSRLSRSAAAIALYTLQSWAPVGGRGHMTGLRGGGPLVTLVVPGEVPTLWQTIWANVPIPTDGTSAPTAAEMPAVFPCRPEGGPNGQVDRRLTSACDPCL